MQVVSCLAVVGIVLLTVPACVQLTGQRITWSYDAVKDEIQILLFYDGIHERSGDNRERQGAREDPEVRPGRRFHAPGLAVSCQPRQVQPKRKTKRPARCIATGQTSAFDPQPNRSATTRARRPHRGSAAAHDSRRPGFHRRGNALISRSILESPIDPQSASLSHPSAGSPHGSQGRLRLDRLGQPQRCG